MANKPSASKQKTALSFFSNHSTSTRIKHHQFSCAIIAFTALFSLTNTAEAKFKDITPHADAHIAEQQPTSANGSSTQLFVQSADNTDTFGNEHSWFQFDLTGQIPNSALINSAKLRFYVFSAPTSASDSIPVEVVGVADNWDESNLTWNTAAAISTLDTTPAAGNQAATLLLEANKTYDWYEVDVTDFVVDQFQNDATKLVSLALQLQAGQENANPARQVRFNSREFSTNLAPRLRIDFNGSWPTSANDVTIIHTNDIHSRLTTHELDFPDADGEAPSLEEAGGAAYFAAKIVELKAANPDALIIDAGDVSEGNPLGDLRGNGGTTDFFQTLNAQLKALGGRGFDAIVVGNHDVRELAMIENMRDPDGDGILNGWIDTNADNIVDTFNAPGTDPDDVPYIAVNLLTDGASVPAPSSWPQENPFKPFVVITQPSGVRVGVLGYLTDDSAVLTAETVNVIDVKETTWSDTDADTVDIKDWVEHLRKPTAQGGEEVDIVVLLSHIGHRRLNATTQPLLGDTGDVAPPDVVVSGHWHTWVDTAWQPSNLNYQTTNVEAASYGQYVGELTLTPEGRYLDAFKHPINVADMVIPASGPVKNTFDAVNTLLATLETEYNNQTVSDPEHDPCILVENGSLTEAQVQALFPHYDSGENCPLDLVIGSSTVDLTLDKDKWNTLSEFPWSGDNTAGEWISDGMVWKVRDLGLSADLALQSGGGIRRDLAAGDLTYVEIYEAYPWDDDGMVRVQMTSKEIVEYIQGHFVGSSLSSDWQVTATDGIVDSVAVDTDQNGSYETLLNPTDAVTEWHVLISEYMYDNDDWINETSGSDDTFTQIDPTPEYLDGNGTTSGTPVASPLEIRNSLIEYTHEQSPINVIGPRYILNTEIAGEFEAVVTMTADAETQPYFEAVFVRLLSASAETIARRNLAGDDYGLDALVNADGSLNQDHEFIETMLYRSHLGFPDGYLQVGDRLTINGEFGFFEGNPQFVDQEGILAAETEFDLNGNTPASAMPTFYGKISEFFTETKENHLVKFYAEQIASNQVRDGEGTEITVYREGGFFSSSTYLPGNTGDCIELIGVHTHRVDSSTPRRFRLREASVISSDPATCFPPASALTVSGLAQAGSTLTLTATAEDLNGVTSTSTPSVINSNVVYNNIQGGAIFAAMDIDGEGALSTQTLTFSGININGESNLQFSAFFAEDDDGSNQDWDNPDSFIAQYRIDGGSWINLFAIENDGSTFNSAPFVDTDFNGVGDGSEITDTFTEYSANIAGTGATLDILFTLDLDSGDEDIAFDNVRISSNSGDIFLEDFEDASVLYTTSIPEFSDGSYDFFTRTGSGAGSTTQLFGTVVSVAFYYSVDGGATTLIGTDSNSGDGWSIDFIPSSGGDYSFYSLATDDDGNVEWAPFYPDSTVPVANAPQPESEEIPFLPLWAMWLLAGAFGFVGIKARKRS